MFEISTPLPPVIKRALKLFLPVSIPTTLNSTHAVFLTPGSFPSFSFLSCMDVPSQLAVSSLNNLFGLQSVGTDTMTGGVMNVNTQIHLANVRSNSPIEPPKNLRMISFHPTLKWSSSTRGMKWRAHGREYVLDQSRAYLGTVCLDLSYAYTMQTLRRDPSSPFRKPHTCEDK